MKEQTFLVQRVSSSFPVNFSFWRQVAPERCPADPQLFGSGGLISAESFDGLLYCLPRDFLKSLGSKRCNCLLGWDLRCVRRSLVRISITVLRRM